MPLAHGVALVASGVAAVKGFDTDLDILQDICIPKRLDKDLCGSVRAVHQRPNSIITLGEMNRTSLDRH